MKLHELRPPKGARRSPKRVGRGHGSGWGKTAGRGTKGQNARSGGGVRPGFEGGQMPLQRRLPKRGFTNVFKKEYTIINIRDLVRFERETEVDEDALIKVGLLRRRHKEIKLLGQGEINYPLVIKVNRCSRSAREKIEAAGGRIEII
nr:50S ribosomal protein L15 [Desulfobacterales bacterium]